jgi:hypothetical protein
MTHPDLMIALARSRIDDLRRCAARGAGEHTSRRHRRLSVRFVDRETGPLIRHHVQRDRSAARRLDGIEGVDPELVRSP